MKTSKTSQYFFLVLSRIRGMKSGTEGNEEHKKKELARRVTMKRSGLRMSVKCLVLFQKIALLTVLSLLNVNPAGAEDAPIPAGTEVISYEPTEYPRMALRANDRKPIGVGSVAIAGENLALQVALPQFDGPVDVYYAIQTPSPNPEIFLVNADLSLVPIASGLVKWKDNLAVPVEESLYGTIPVSALPPGTYYVYIMLTPHDDLGKYTLHGTSFEIPPNKMAPPSGQEIFPPHANALPMAHTTAANAIPIGLGSVAAGGNDLTVRIGLPEFSAPVDVYLAADWPAVDPDNIYLITEQMEFSPLSSGLVKWKENFTGPLSEVIMSDISISEFPSGIYKFYLMVTPAGSTDRFFFWRAEFSSSTLMVDIFGNGVVTSDTNGINCSEDSENCSASYEPGTTVELTATPDADSVFQSWEGCDSVNGNICTVIINTSKTVHPSFALRETKLNPFVKVLDSAAVAYIVMQEGATYYFDPQIATLVTLQPGDIMVSTVGLGFLRRVINVMESNGLIVVETEEASLVDAVQEGDFIASSEDFSLDLGTSRLASGVRVLAARRVAGKPQIDMDISKVIYENGPVKVTLVGNLTLEFKPDFKLSIGRKNWVVPYVKQFRMILEMNNTNDLTLIAQGSWQGQKRIKLGTMRFTPIPLGYIVLLPQADLYVGVEAGIGASMTAGVTIGASLKTGVIYKRETGWDPVGSFKPNFSFNPPTLSAQLYAKGYVSPEFTMLLYGIAGPSVSLNGYLRMDAWVPPLSWALSAGVQACVGGKVDLVFKEKRLSDWCPIRYELLLAQHTPPGVLEVTPAGEFDLAGPEGGPFTFTKVYTLKNTGYERISWSVSASRDWVDVGKNINMVARSGVQIQSASPAFGQLASIISGSPSSGQLSPGDSVSVVVSLSAAANSLQPGEHTASVNFVNSTSGEGNTSRNVSVTVEAVDDIPSPPSGLTAKASSPSSLDLTWGASTDDMGVMGYVIERCTGNGCTNFTQIGKSTTTNFSDTGLSASTTYTYRVKAFDGAENYTDYSNPASATTPPEDIPPTVPGNLTATPHETSTQIQLNWVASTDSGGSGLTGYEVERCIGSGCTDFSPIGKSTPPNFTDPGLSASTVYTYRVRAFDGAGNPSGYSNSASATTISSSDIIPPTVPGNVAATSTSPSEIELTWSGSNDSGGSGLAFYQIEQCTGSTCTTSNIPAYIAGTPTTHVIQMGLEQSTTYTYRLRAYDNAGNHSDYSNPSSATTPPEDIPPTVPGNLTANGVTANQIDLSWAASVDSGGSGLKEYEIERCTGNGCIDFGFIGTSTTTGYVDLGLNASTAYTYRVRAFDGAGNPSEYSNLASAWTGVEIIPPTVPGNLTWTQAFPSNHFVVDLSWTASVDSGGSGLKEYEIERCTGNGCIDFGFIGTSTTTTFTETALNAEFYTYRVRARDNAGNPSEYSNTLTFLAPDTISPSVPGNLTAIAAGTNQVNLTWSGSTDNGGSRLAGYWIERCAGVGCTDFTQIGSSTTASFSDTGLSPATYSYRVASYDDQGNFSGYSNIAVGGPPDTISPTAPGNLTVVQADPYAFNIELTWGASTDSGGSGLAGYSIERCGEPFVYTVCTNFGEIGTPTTPSFPEVLYPGTYNYRVRAYDNAGNPSGYSNTTSVTVFEPPV